MPMCNIFCLSYAVYPRMHTACGASWAHPFIVVNYKYTVYIASTGDMDHCCSSPRPHISMCFTILDVEMQSMFTAGAA